MMWFIETTKINKNVYIHILGIHRIMIYIKTTAGKFFMITSIRPPIFVLNLSFALTV